MLIALQPASAGMLSTACLSLLLCKWSSSRAAVLSSVAYDGRAARNGCTPCDLLQVSELQWKHRVLVKGYKGAEEGVFEFFMVKRLGGRYDGTWFTRQLTCDGCPNGSLSV